MLLWLNGGKRQPLKLLEKKFSPRGFDSLQKHQMNTYVKVFKNLKIDKKYLFKNEEGLSLNSQKCRSEIRKYLYKLGYDLNDMEIISSPNGKPYFKNIKINFSFSHTKSFSAFVISSNKVGIDIEVFNPLRNYYKLSKRLNINGDFLREWTKREAILKATDGNFPDLLSPVKKKVKMSFSKKDDLYLHIAEI